MRKLIFILSSLGLLAGLTVAYLSGITQPPLPPAFSPPVNPYPNGIYAEGIIESDQPSGENVSIYPEVSGTVKRILVAEGSEGSRSLIDRRFNPASDRPATVLPGPGSLHPPARVEGGA